MIQTIEGLKWRGWVLLVILILVIAGFSCTLEPPLKLLPDKQVVLSGGGMSIRLHSLSGRIINIVEEPSGYDLLKPWPDSDQGAGLGIEITDELDNKKYNDLKDSVVVRDFIEAEHTVEFEKHVRDPGLLLRQKIWEDHEGINIRYMTSMKEQEAALRSVSFSYLIPLPEGLHIWAPNGAGELVLDGKTSARFVHGPGADKGSAISIPIVSFWKPDGPSFSVAVPLEIRTVRVSFTVDPARLPESATPGPEDCDWLKVTFDLVGIGQGRILETGLWLFAHESGWRSALKIFSDRYKEYFESTRRIGLSEGFMSRVEPADMTTAALSSLQRQEAIFTKLDWNYYRSGEWIPPQALRFDDFTWNTGPESKYKDISVNLVRSSIENLHQFKLRPVLYSAYNGYCEKDLADERFLDDIAFSESNKPLYYGENGVRMHVSAESKLGREMLIQQDRMIQLYPQATGFYIDNWDIDGIDFAHDDSLTVVHNRAAYSLAENRRSIGMQLLEKIGKQRKMTFAGPPQSIVDCRQIDVLTLNGDNLNELERIAFMGLRRPLAADLEPDYSLSQESAEDILKKELIWGVIPSVRELYFDRQIARAYWPLFQNLKGREWALESHALKLSPELEGQVFYAPVDRRNTEQDVVVCLVRSGIRLSDNIQRSGAWVRLKVADAEEYIHATFTPATANPWPIPVKIERVGLEKGQELKIILPAFGPAGVLRLSRAQSGG